VPQQITSLPAFFRRLHYLHLTFVPASRFLLTHLTPGSHSKTASSFIGPDGIAALFLLNPFTIMACVSGSTSSLEMLCVMLAVWRGCKGDASGAALAIAAAGYQTLHPLLLVVSTPPAVIV
jgi:hypothetical protein